MPPVRRENPKDLDFAAALPPQLGNGEIMEEGEISEDDIDLVFVDADGNVDSQQNRSKSKDGFAPRNTRYGVQRLSLNSDDHDIRLADDYRRRSSLLLSGLTGPSRQKLRIILAGDPGVGKSTFLHTLANGHFCPANRTSNLLSSQVCLSVHHAGYDVELDIQDTAGQERFRSLTASYYRYAQGCLLFFNVNDRESFQNISTWLDDINLYHSRDGNISVVLVGMLHRPSGTRGVSGMRRQNSRRGVSSDNHLGKSNSDNSANNNNDNSYNNNNKFGEYTVSHSPRPERRQVDHQQQQHLLQPQQQQKHKKQTSPLLPAKFHRSLEPSDAIENSPYRDIPRGQAEHMASMWEIPYREVDTKADHSSVLGAVHTLLDSILSRLIEDSRITSDSITPGSYKRNRLQSTTASGKFNPNTCCWQC